jgi:uncharacterized repeat protein (TIGR01451 family)
MHANEQRCPAILRAVSVTLGIALLALLPLTPASATEVGAQPAGSYSTSSAVSVAPPTPQLSIALENGRTSAAVGDTATYTITVRNLGNTRLTGLQVTQSVPTGLSFRSADSAGVAKAGTVSWRLNLEASGKATLHTKMSVSKTPKDLLRLASVSCASASTEGPPIVCATDSDQLPAGVAAEARKAGAATGSGTAATPSDRNGWYAAGGLGGIVLVTGVFVVLMLRRRRAASAGRHSEELTREADA